MDLQKSRYKEVSNRNCMSDQPSLQRVQRFEQLSLTPFILTTPTSGFVQAFFCSSKPSFRFQNRRISTEFFRISRNPIVSFLLMFFSLSLQASLMGQQILRQNPRSVIKTSHGSEPKLFMNYKSLAVQKKILLLVSIIYNSNYLEINQLINLQRKTQFKFKLQVLATKKKKFTLQDETTQ